MPVLRSILLFLLPALCAVAPAGAQPVDFQTSNLPILILRTNGLDIVDEPKITATMQIVDNGPGAWNDRFDPPNGFDGLVGIELRGSSSQALYPKKAYSIEVRDETGADQAVSLLGMPKESDWALI